MSKEWNPIFSQERKRRNPSSLILGSKVDKT